MLSTGVMPVSMIQYMASLLEEAATFVVRNTRGAAVARMERSMSSVTRPDGSGCRTGAGGS